MQIEIQIPKAVLFDVKYTVEQATNFAKKEVALGFYMQKGVSSEEVLYIGDSEVDAATGNAADMDTVLVEWGFRSREELEKADAYRIVAAADEILDIIR